MKTWTHLLSWTAVLLLVAGAVVSLLHLRIARRRRWIGLAVLLILAAVAVAAINLPWFRSATMLVSGVHELAGAAVLMAAAALVLATLVSAGTLLRQHQAALNGVSELRRGAEKTLRRYQRMVETLPDAFVILENGRIRFVNRAFARIFGIDEEAALDRTLAEIVSPSGSLGAVAQWPPVSPDRNAWEGEAPKEVFLRRPDGEHRWIQARFNRVSRLGEPGLDVAVIRDVTEERNASNLRRVLYEITLEAQRDCEPQELFAALQRVLNKVMDARSFFVALYDAERDELSFPFYRDEMTPEAPPPMPPGKTLCGYVLRNGTPFFVDSTGFRDLQKRGEVELVGHEPQDWIGVPLMLHGRPAGVLAVQSYTEEKVYGKNEEALLTAAAGHLARLLELTRARRALREREERYRAIFDHSPTGIVQYDREWRVIDCNERLAAIVGSTRDQLLGLDLSQLDDRRPVAALQRALEGREGSYDGWYEPTRGVRKAWLSARTAPIFDENNEVHGAVALIEDQTAARLAEEELRRRDAIIESLSRAGQRLLACEDPDEAISAALAEIGLAAEADRVSVHRIVEPTGGRKEAVSAQSWIRSTATPASAASLDVVGPDALSRWSATLQSGETISGPVRDFPSSERMALARAGIRSLALIPVAGAGRWWGVMAVEDHQRERSFPGAEIEALRLAAATMGAAIHHNEAEQRLRMAEKMEAIGHLTSGIAHDFNNVLMAIRCSVDQLRGDPPPEPSAASRSLEIIDTATQRATTMIRHLLAFSRRQVIEPRPLDLNQLLVDFLPTARRIVPENINIEHIPEPGVAPVLADASQMEQVLINLLVNSRDAMPDGGTITIETRSVLIDGAYLTDHPWAHEGHHVVLIFSDTGCGMDSELLSRVFEPFFTTKQTGQGTGLGLATVYGIVKQHNGMVHIYSEPGLGTTVKVFLPVVEGRIDVREPPELAPVRGGTETILLVEDDENVREVVQGILRELGYTVIVTGDGREALGILQDRAEEINLVISDVVMPHVGGKELADAVAGRWPHLRFLFITGYSENVIHRGFIGLPGVAFLTKPFGRDQLARKIRAILGQS